MKPIGPERVCAVRIEAGQAGATVLDFVTGRFTYLTREQWELELAAGRLLVNGEPVAPEQILAAADRVSYQIRATLCSLGFPVVGDKIYGLDEELFLRFLADQLTPADHHQLRLPRQALHSAALKMRHPADQRPLEFCCPLPPQMAELLP